MNKYEKLVVHYGFIPALPVIYFQAAVLARNGEVNHQMTPMYIMILLLSIAMILLMTWTYYLMFNNFGFCMPFKSTPDSMVQRICDNHLHERKLIFTFKKVFFCLAFYLIAESCLMLNCAILGNVYTQAQCVNDSLFSHLFGNAVPVTIIIHILFLVSTDLLPAFAFLYLYLPGVQTVISDHIMS